MIRRSDEKKIKDWIEDGEKALLVTGARQTGKTFLIRECLKEMEASYIELNFIEHPEYIKLLDDGFSVKDFILRLSAISNRKLIPGETIIFMDEIQENREVVSQIKFLVEEGSFKYIMSGSLLGIELKNVRSVPVGYMDVLDMYPLSLEEFFRAVGISETVMENIRECFEKRHAVDAFVNEKLLELFKLYLIVGGMPEAVQRYIDTNDLAQVAKVQKSIIRLYKLDFTKYEDKYNLKLKEIYDAIPAELNEKNKRFFINHLGSGKAYERVKNDFLWLKDAGVVLPVYNVTEPVSPLVISEKRNLFKLFMSDVGLLTSMYPNGIKIKVLLGDADVNNGALYENAVAQELVAHGIALYYYNNKAKGELDFVIEPEGRALPIEVKSGKNYKKHSALDNVLSNDGYGLDGAFVLCNGNVEICDKRIYLPIYMAMFIKQKSLPDGLIYKVDLTQSEFKL